MIMLDAHPVDAQSRTDIAGTDNDRHIVANLCQPCEPKLLNLSLPKLVVTLM